MKLFLSQGCCQVLQIAEIIFHLPYIEAGSHGCYSFRDFRLANYLDPCAWIHLDWYLVCLTNQRCFFDNRMRSEVASCWILGHTSSSCFGRRCTSSNSSILAILKVSISTTAQFCTSSRWRGLAAGSRRCLPSCWSFGEDAGRSTEWRC